MSNSRPAGGSSPRVVSADMIEYESHSGKPMERTRWQTFRILRLPGVDHRTTIGQAKALFGPHNSDVTTTYTSLSNQMRQYLNVPASDAGPEGATTEGRDGIVDWCGFASWVSFSLGAFLMPEQDSDALALHPRIRRWVIGRVLPKLLTTEEWMGLAAGNIQIFREMEALYELVFSCSGDSLAEALDEADRRTDALWYGDDFKGVEATSADRYWARHAVKSLLLAAATDDRSQKSQLILSASIALSAIEQRRADDQIDAFFEGMVRNRRWLPGIFHKLALRLTIRVTTRWLTHFLLPDGFISVGRALRLPDPTARLGGRDTLAEVTNPWARVAIDACYTEPQPRSTDWTSYGQRMNFIAALFRAYQEVPEVLLFDWLEDAEPIGSVQPLFADEDPDRLTALVEATLPESDPPTI